MEVPMLKQAETINKIVASRGVPFPYIVAELYDLIFQKCTDEKERRRLFVYALVSLDEHIYKDQNEGPQHLFTGVVLDENQNLDPLSYEEIVILYANLKGIKSCGDTSEVKRVIRLYRFFRYCVPESMRYITFSLVLRSGFFPLNQETFIFFFGDGDEEREEQAIRRLRMMNWLCGDHDTALVGFATNLIIEHRKWPMIQRAIVLKLAEIMKGRGFDGCYDNHPRKQDDALSPVDWKMMKENARGILN